MSTLVELNTYSTNTITYTDNRPSGVILTYPNARDVTRTILTQTTTLQRRIDIVEIVQPLTANVQFIVDVNDVVGATVDFGILPSGCSVQQVGDTYTITGIDSVSDWESVRAPTITVPDTFFGSFYSTATIRYFDNNLGQTVDMSWTDGNYIPAALLESASTISIAPTKLAGLGANLNAFYNVEAIPQDYVLVMQASLSCTPEVQFVLLSDAPNITYTTNNPFYLTNGPQIIAPLQSDMDLTITPSSALAFDSVTTRYIEDDYRKLYHAGTDDDTTIIKDINSNNLVSVGQFVYDLDNSDSLTTYTGSGQSFITNNYLIIGSGTSWSVRLLSNDTLQSSISITLGANEVIRDYCHNETYFCVGVASTAGSTGLGKVLVYNLSTGVLDRTITKTYSSQFNYSAFGLSIAINLSNEILIGGSYRSALSDVIYQVYLYNASTGSQLKIFEKSDNSYPDFGTGGMAINDDYVVIASNIDILNDPGEIFIFDANHPYSELHYLTANDIRGSGVDSTYDLTGIRDIVINDNNIVALTSNITDEVSQGAGVYEINLIDCVAGTKIRTYNNPDLSEYIETDEYYGRFVAMNDDYLVAHTAELDTTDAYDYLYDLTESNPLTFNSVTKQLTFTGTHTEINDILDNAQIKATPATGFSADFTINYEVERSDGKSGDTDQNVINE